MSAATLRLTGLRRRDQTNGALLPTLLFKGCSKADQPDGRNPFACFVVIDKGAVSNSTMFSENSCLAVGCLVAFMLLLHLR